MLVATFILKSFFHENILLMERIPLTECLGNGCEETGEFVVAVNISRELLYRILETKHCTIFASLGIEHTHVVHILHGEVDVLKDFLSLTTCSKGIDRDCHAQAKGGKG